MKTITAKEIIELKDKGHVIGIYPRKGIVCVDGFKYFKASKAAIIAAKG